MGGSASKSDSDSESGFNQSVWGHQGEALKNMYGQLGNLFTNTTDGMQNQTSDAVNWMQGIQNQTQPAWQNQMEGGAYKDMGLQDSLMNSINQSMSTPSAMSQINAMTMGGDGNNYADAMKGQYIQDANAAQQNMLQNLDARAAAAGMSGGSRHGIATAQGMDDINQNLQGQLAKTGFDTFDKDLERKLGIAQQADSNNLARQGMMQNMLGQQQNAMSGGVQYGQNMQNLGMGSFAPYMMPWQAAGSYANAIGRPTVLGSGSAESNSKGFGGGFM